MHSVGDFRSPMESGDLWGECRRIFQQLLLGSFTLLGPNQKLIHWGWFVREVYLGEIVLTKLAYYESSFELTSIILASDQTSTTSAGTFQVFVQVEVKLHVELKHSNVTPTRLKHQTSSPAALYTAWQPRQYTYNK